MTRERYPVLKYRGTGGDYTAKLRKTLPKNFNEIVTSCGVEEIKAVLRKCEPDAAYSTYDKRTALMNPDLPEEVIRWLVSEYGAEINYSDNYCRTPLNQTAVFKPENIGTLVSLGADVNFQKNADSPTALIYAARCFSVEGVRGLIECGADVFRTVRVGYTDITHNALDEALRACSNARTPETAKIARILIDAGIPVTDSMRKRVADIGRTFEFYRDSFDPDYLPVCDAGLCELYELFDVPPAPSKRKYDGSEPITVCGKTWHAQYNELWEMLVPGSGKAKFVQGEALRIAGKLSHEILDNGSVNWDEDYRAMKDELADIISGGCPADEEIIRAVRNISPNTCECTFNKIAEAVVGWILSNPEPKELETVSYRR